MMRLRNQAPAAVAENIEKIIRAEEEALKARSLTEAIADAIGGFVGTISFVGAQLLAFACWIIVNAGKIPWLAPFDPFPYPLLSTVTSLEAVLLAAFVLMKQNRLGVIADRRDHLDLQVNLLTERRATQVIQMLDQLSRHFGLEPHQNPESRELGEAIAIERLVEEVHSRLPKV